MFTTKNTIKSISEVPDVWIYKHYLNIDINNLPSKIHSPFREDNIPSFGFFVVGDKVLWKDLKTRESGNALSLALRFELKQNPNLKEKDIYTIITRKFSENSKNYNIVAKPVLKKKSFSVKENLRKWNDFDIKYWGQFGITIKDLMLNGVKPIDNYIMTVNDNSFTCRNIAIYGYYTKDNKLYKLYQPLNKDQKFVTIDMNIIEGFDYIRYKKYRGILSGKKDILSLNTLGLDIDGFAGNSETTFLTKKEIELIKPDFCLMDNDQAGIDSMLYYKEKYNIPYVYFPYEKDISDSIKNYGKEFTKNILVPKINYCLNESNI